MKGPAKQCSKCWNRKTLRNFRKKGNVCIPCEKIRHAAWRMRVYGAATK